MESLPVDLKLKILSFMNNGNGVSVTDEPKVERIPQFLKFLDESKLKFLSKADIELLEKRGYIIKDNLLGVEESHAIRDECNNFMKEGRLKSGAMGRGESHWKVTRVRGDVITWLRPNEPEPQSKDDENKIYWIGKESLQETAIMKLMEKLDSIKSELNEACNFNSKKVSIQLACYPKSSEGRHYARHLDAFEGGPDRRLTCIYYANPDWKEEDGGKLRAYVDEGFADIEPIGDRLLIFLSGKIEHEVLLSFTDRFAITTWMY